MEFSRDRKKLLKSIPLLQVYLILMLTFQAHVNKYII